MRSPNSQQPAAQTLQERLPAQPQQAVQGDLFDFGNDLVGTFSKPEVQKQETTTESTNLEDDLLDL